MTRNITPLRPLETDLLDAKSSALDLSASELWGNERFQEIFVAGLARDGLSQHLTQTLLLWLREKPVTRYEEFRNYAENRLSIMKEADRRELSAVFARLDRTIHFNRTCFSLDTPEKVRVKRWPNNPKTKADYPEQYVDIFEDFFYRDTHRFISKDTPIGSAGSCFALRIAHQLQAWNYNYIIEEDDLPDDLPLERISETSFRMSPARVGTLYNAPSLRQMVERAFGEWAPDKLITRDRRNRVADPFRTINAHNDVAGFEADFEKHNIALHKALSKCDVFILTLGLTQAWKFAHTGDYTSVSPTKIDPTLVRSHDLSIEDNVRELERLWEVYNRHKPGIKMIVSVSPVPLNRSYAEHSHVVVANFHSKAKLRVAADLFVQNHYDSVFYLPSYEMVMFGTRNPWEADMRHVSGEAIKRVMRLFQKIFLVDQTPLPVFMHEPPPLPSRNWIRHFARPIAKRILPYVRPNRV